MRADTHQLYSFAIDVGFGANAQDSKWPSPYSLWLEVSDMLHSSSDWLGRAAGH